MEELYRKGNDAFAAGDLESAVRWYSLALDDCRECEAMFAAKLRCNRGYCQLKLRNYCSAVEDFNRVIDQLADGACESHVDRGKILCKAFLRRASCLENMLEFKLALQDLERAVALSPAVLQDKHVNSQLARLRAAVKSDAQAAQREPRWDNLVTSAQSLRLNFLTQPPDVIMPDSVFQCKLCLGNEFGLFDRLFYGESKGKLCLAVDLSSADSTDHSQAIATSCSSDISPTQPPLGRLACEVVNLTGRAAWSVHRKAMAAPIWEIGRDGKISMDLLVRCRDPSLAHDKIILRFFILDHNMRIGMGAILPLLSLPITITTESSSAKPDERGNLSDEGNGGDDVGTLIRRAAQPIHANCIRSLEGRQGESIYVLESAGLLGIGGKIWDSSLALIRFLFEHADELVRGKSIIELGSGTGITGLSLASLAPRKVLLTDLDSVVPLLRANTSLSSCLASHGDVASKLRMCYCSAELAWGSENLPSDLEVETVVASDVVYAPECYQPLVHTLRSLLGRSEGTCCILAHRHRNPEDHRFFALLNDDANFRVEECEWKGEQPELLQTDIRIFKISYRGTVSI